jgi:predicted N-acyltransferase
MNTPELKNIENLADIPAAQWDALAGGDPFLSHAYLYALQESGCVSAEFGWHAQFLTLWHDGSLLGAMPLYLKMNSYGEHVFDFAWADAYHRNGLNYYPKLLCAVPFTPVAGPRFLAASDEVRALLLRSALQFTKDTGMSSLHCLFLNEADRRAAQAQGMLMRQDVQFHWPNPGYRAFDDFLGTMVLVIAGIVRFVAVVLPLGLLVAGIVWLVRKPLGGLFRKRRPQGGKPQPSALEDNPPTP